MTYLAGYHGHELAPINKYWKGTSLHSTTSLNSSYSKQIQFKMAYVDLWPFKIIINI